MQHAKCQLITAAELAHSFDPLTARLFRTCLFAACRAKFNPRQRRKDNSSASLQSHAVESATPADCGFHGSGAVAEINSIECASLAQKQKQAETARDTRSRGNPDPAVFGQCFGNPFEPPPPKRVHQRRAAPVQQKLSVLPLPPPVR